MSKAELGLVFVATKGGRRSRRGFRVRRVRLRKRMIAFSRKRSIFFEESLRTEVAFPAATRERCSLSEWNEKRGARLLSFLGHRWQGNRSKEDRGLLSF